MKSPAKRTVKKSKTKAKAKKQITPIQKAKNAIDTEETNCCARQKHATISAQLKKQPKFLLKQSVERKHWQLQKHRQAPAVSKLPN